MTLLETRKQYNVSQIEVANLLGVPIRTYIRYEQDDNYVSELKRKTMIQIINDRYEITENKGLLTSEIIKKEITLLFDNEYKGVVKFCYLFGSYAKGYATERSDVDLCIATSLTGLDFVGLSEDIRAEMNRELELYLAQP